METLNQMAGRQKLTNEKVDSLLKLRNKNIQRLEDIKGSQVKIKWKCLNTLCENIWLSIPNNILNHKSGCPDCAGNKRLTNEKVDSLLKLRNKNIQRLEDVVNANTKIKWKCSKKSCEYEWLTSPNIIINNESGCPKCSKSIRLTNDLTDKILENKNIQRLEDIKGSQVKIKWKCLICEHVWKTTPNSITNNGSGCPKCYGNAKINNNRIDELLKINNKNIIRMTEIVQGNTKSLLMWKCLICEHVWKNSINNVLYNKSGCPKCNLPYGENIIRNLLIKYKILFDTKIGYITFSDCINPLTRRKLRFDFCVYNEDGSIKCLIEYDGLDHFLPSKEDYQRNPSRFNMEKYLYTKFKDIIKDRYCDSKGIKLIRIPYWELKNLEKIIKRLIENIFF